MNTQELLQLTQEFVVKCNVTNSTLDKLEVIREYVVKDTYFSKLLNYVFNPFYNYYITSDNVKKMKGKIKGTLPPEHADIFGLLDDLRNRNITGHGAIQFFQAFIDKYGAYENILYNIIDHNLECRIDAKLINKIVPGLVPQFDVALANSYDDVKDKVDFIKQQWFASRKLDGCRCVTIIDNMGNINFYSREGKEFETLGALRQEIVNLKLKSKVLDGEVCVYDPTTLKEDFQGIMKQIRRKDHTIENVKYFVFDMLELEDFNAGKSFFKFGYRYDELRHTVHDNYKIMVLPQVRVDNKNHMEQMMSVAESKGWEGLILRKDNEYAGKRSNDLLKVKKFFDAEYVVKDVECGEMRIINDKGVEEKIMTLTNIFIEHKGFKVGVGSGFSLEQRKEFYNDTSKILGKTITVSYFEETKNQNGGLSLRFPTIKCIHGEKREL